MDLKEAETTSNISDTFGPETANEHTVQWWFKKFYKGGSGQSLVVDNDQLRADQS